MATTVRTKAEQSQQTRRALYYHFRDKAVLFEAVFDEVRGEYLAALRAAIAANGRGRLAAAETGVELCLEGILDPTVQRIVYIDGPAVLDWSSEQRRAPTVALLRELFAPLMAAGIIEQLPLDALLRQLWALFFNAAVDIAQAEEGAVALRDRVIVLRRILNCLRPPRRKDSWTAENAQCVNVAKRAAPSPAGHGV